MDPNLSGLSLLDLVVPITTARQLNAQASNVLPVEGDGEGNGAEEGAEDERLGVRLVLGLLRLGGQRLAVGLGPEGVASGDVLDRVGVGGAGEREGGEAGTGAGDDRAARLGHARLHRHRLQRRNRSEEESSEQQAHEHHLGLGKKDFGGCTNHAYFVEQSEKKVKQNCSHFSCRYL